MNNKKDIIEKLNSVSFYFKSMLQAGDKENAEMYARHRESVKMAIEFLKSTVVITCPKCGEKIEAKLLLLLNSDVKKKEGK